MPEIQLLSAHVADLIAAGEVVDKPASAVKELMENAFDAGAKSVVVDIRGGGRQSIRVTDDGCGMAPEDAGICCLRHATSKLRDERGLEAIGTMGFRGEALAAIASVSRLSLTTRRQGAAQGVRVELTAGEIDSMTELGCPEGTTVQVRDLFYNTPARLKFLGSDRAEGQSCAQTALRSALGRPEISVRCLKDGEEIFFSPGDGRMDSCVYALLGRDTARTFLSVESEGDGVGVRGFVSSPEHCRGNRREQYFFCNGRPIRSQKLTAALEQAYKNTAMVGKFPSCVLYITLANGLVDVNVHPTKAEVRFSHEKAVFDAVYYGVLSALQREDKLSVPAAPPLNTQVSPFPPPAAPARGKSEPRQDFFRHMSSGEFRAGASRWEKSSPGFASAKADAPRERGAQPDPVRPAAVRPAATPAQETLFCRSEERRESASAAFSAPAFSLRDDGEGYAAAVQPFRAGVPVHREEEAAPPTGGEQGTLTAEFQQEGIRLIGEALGVYILLEQGDKLILIDKHAAHERALFDRIISGGQRLMSQELLIPAVIAADAVDMELFESSRETLEELGFAAEPYGEESLMLRAVPADIDAEAAAPLFEELLEKLREGRALSVRDVRERLAETIACKAAIKGGRRSEREELLALAGRVLSGELKYCPHGRPVAAVFTRQELDRRFDRIV